MSHCWIGIGANLGDARAAFDDAWLDLFRHPRIHLQNRSGIYRTSPVGADAGGTFSNAALSLETSLSPIELLDLLQEIETGLGRIRDVRWGPRSIDLDLLFADQIILRHPRLTLPHPAAWYRRFVLDPLVEVEATLLHPLLNETIGALQRRLKRRPLVVGLADRSIISLSNGRSELARRFPQVQFESRLDGPTTPIVCIHLDPSTPAGPLWNGVPVADLTAAPGEPLQRVIDFCTAILDEPIRVSDW